MVYYKAIEHTENLIFVSLFSSPTWWFRYRVRFIVKA